MMKPPTKPKLTDAEKLVHKQRVALTTLCNRIESRYSMGHKRTWADVYEISGKPTWSNEQGPITYVQLKAYCAQLQAEFERNVLARVSVPSNGEAARPEGGPTDSEAPQEIPVVNRLEQVTQPHSQVSLVHNEERLHLTRSDCAAPVEQEADFLNTSDYGLPVNTNHRAFLFWFQKKAVKEILDGFLGFDVATCKDVVELRTKYEKNKSKASTKRGMLLLAATGTGKTFISGAVLRYLLDIGFHEDKTFGHTYYLYVTKSTIVEQTKRVFESTFLFGLKQGIEVVNIEQLRARAGEVWIKEEIVIREGVEHVQYKWKGPIAPCVIFWDESQGLKNDTSTQSKIAQAYNEIPVHTYQLFISATPFTRVCEAKCFAVATRKDVSSAFGLGSGMVLSNANWPTYASSIASPSAPDEHNEAAVERLVKDLDSFIVRVRGVRPQFDARNNIQMISFESVEEQQYYEEAMQRYEREKLKLVEAGLKQGGNSDFQILVEFLKFRMAAEYCRRKHLAKLMYEAVQDGKAAVCALNFKNTIIAVVKILHYDYNVPRDMISLVWGGGQTDLTKKQKMKAKIMEKVEALKAIGEDPDELLKTLALDEVEDRVLEDLPPELRLATQNRDERQKEIDRFQSGRSLYCLYTFRAGGVGLSLHHTDEFIPDTIRKESFNQLDRSVDRQQVEDILKEYKAGNVKDAKLKWVRNGHKLSVDHRRNLTRLLGCRRKESGYVFPEDVEFVPVRQRRVYVAPTYSAIELVQGLGRCPRLTSLTDTLQTLLFYAGTVEVDVSHVVSQKLRCLSKVVRQRETWQAMIVKGSRKELFLDKDVKDEAATNYDDLTPEEGEDE